MNNSIIIFLIICNMLFTGCDNQKKNEIGKEEFQKAQERVIYIATSRMFSDCSIVKSEYNKKEKKYILYLNFISGDYKKAIVDMTSKDEQGRYNYIIFEEWSPEK